MNKLELIRSFAASGKTVYVKKEDLPAFCSQLLPKIKDWMERTACKCHVSHCRCCIIIETIIALWFQIAFLIFPHPVRREDIRQLLWSRNIPEWYLKTGWMLPIRSTNWKISLKTYRCSLPTLNETCISAFSDISSFYYDTAPAMRYMALTSSSLEKLLEATLGRSIEAFIPAASARNWEVCQGKPDLSLTIEGQENGVEMHLNCVYE